MAKRFVIVGVVAAGPKLASKIIRLMPDPDVTVVQKGRLLSYAGCGLPYYVSGVVKEQSQLLSTPVGTVRDSVVAIGSARGGGGRGASVPARRDHPLNALPRPTSPPVASRRPGSWQAFSPGAPAASYDLLWRKLAIPLAAA